MGMVAESQTCIDTCLRLWGALQDPQSAPPKLPTGLLLSRQFNDKHDMHREVLGEIIKP